MVIEEDENGCCTMVVLREFGEETPSMTNHLQKNSPSAKDFPQFIVRLRKKIIEFNGDQNDEEYYEPSMWNHYQGGYSDATWFENRALITATTVDTQPMAESFLKQFGFKRIGPIKKKKHKNTKLSFWHLRIPTFLKLLEKHEKELAQCVD